jgi:murein DD-endopeptidase MepM/ murein hydrolase activator NlpD
MRMKEFFAAIADTMSALYQGLFHKRNIIIVSERKVKHVPISGRLQVAVIAASITAICWASYSTGSYFAVHSAFEQQSQTLKSVVENRVESNFSLHSNNELPALTPLAGSKAAISSVDSSALFSRISELQDKLTKAEKSKKEFIDKIEERTSKNIDSFESLIEQTGLDVDTLKTQNGPTKTKAASNNKKDDDAQVGPYIPDSLSDAQTRESQVISRLDELAVLKQIVENLPVRKPILGYQEMSQFGRRIDPFTGRLAFHSGIDLAGPAGSKIMATADGKVSFTGRAGAYGIMVDVDHGFGISTRYAHLSQILVEDNQLVKKGQVIAVQGSTGRSTGAHLHYEVRYKDQPLDPRKFLGAGRYVQKS